MYRSYNEGKDNVSQIALCARHLGRWFWAELALFLGYCSLGATRNIAALLLRSVGALAMSATDSNCF